MPVPPGLKVRTGSGQMPLGDFTAFTATAGGIRVTAMWSGSGHGAPGAVGTYGELGRPSTASLGGVTFLDL